MANEINVNAIILKKQLLKIGGLLTEAKKITGHGNFQNWVEHNCDFSYQTANNFMNVYKQCYGFPDVVEAIPSSVLYTISAPKFPNELRQQIFEYRILPTSRKELIELVKSIITMKSTLAHHN